MSKFDITDSTTIYAEEVRKRRILKYLRELCQSGCVLKGYRNKPSQVNDSINAAQFALIALMAKKSTK